MTAGLFPDVCFTGGGLIDRAHRRLTWDVGRAVGRAQVVVRHRGDTASRTPSTP